MGKTDIAFLYNIRRAHLSSASIPLMCLPRRAKAAITDPLMSIEVGAVPPPVPPVALLPLLFTILAIPNALSDFLLDLLEPFLPGVVVGVVSGGLR